MTHLLEIIFFLSLKGSIAALGVWLVCGLLHRLHAPRQLCRILWLAVLIRMVCPVGIPVSLPQVSPAPLQEAVHWEETAPSEEAVFSVQPDTPVSSSVPSLGTQLLVLGWCAGAAGLMLHALTSSRKLKKQVALAYRTQEGFYTGEGVTTPFVLGTFAPKIYLPGGLDPRQREGILLHEQTHIRQLDHFFKPFCYLVICLHWFNPLAWLAYRQFSLESEAACDEAVAARLEPSLRKDYCQSLVDFALSPSLTLQPLALGQSNVKARVTAILGYKKPAVWALVLSLALALGMGLACFAQPVEGQSLPSKASVPETAREEAAVFSLPAEEYNYISCRFGSNPDNFSYHKGIDLAADQGTPVLAAASGVVTTAQNHWSYGNYVVVDHGNGLTTLYAHLDTLTVEEGETVTAAQQLGTVGRTGNVTGNCLHFEVRENGTVTDPETYLNLES